MSARSARFEIVRTDAEQPWHARFRAANGRVVWTTENYAKRRGALDAIWLMAETMGGFVHDTEVMIRAAYSLGHTVAEVRDVDERESPR